MTAQHVCPWWVGYLLASPLRRLYQDPRTLLAPFVLPGMTVLEPGPGMGFFTLELARLVGPNGRVVAVELQQRMLDTLARRARRAGLAERIGLRKTDGARLGVDDLVGVVDFALAFAVVHEIRSPGPFFEAIERALRPGGKLLLSEPRGHVPASDFARTLELARQAGLGGIHGEVPRIRGCHAALLGKTEAL